MSVEDLIPEIVIGKKYLWKSFPIESECPSCGANLGNSTGEFEYEVFILDTAIGFARPHYCYKCGIQLPDIEGWYAVSTLFGRIGCVPYTQLEEIEESED